MPLSEDLRDELAAIKPGRECDRLAELSALFHSAGSLRLHGRGHVSAALDLAGSAVTRRAFALLRSFGVTSEIRTYRQHAFARGQRTQLVVDGNGRALQLLHEAGVVSAGLGPLNRPPQRVVSRSCCRRAYLRGALLASGSLSGPRSAQLEIRSATVEGAEFLAGLARVERLRLGVRERDRHAAAYAKGAQAIADLLLAVGAQRLVLELEERAVVAATRSRANRLANADHANLVRTSRAAQEQLRAVRRLQRSGRLERLPAHLREVADLRLAHPTISLRELALRCNPPVAKATAHRRLERLVRLVRG